MKVDRQLMLLIGVSLFVIMVGILLLLFSSSSEGGLSDETKELVDDLRWKHYGYITYDTADWDFVYDWTTISFDDESGILYVETDNGVWFIEMERKEETK